MLRLGRGETVTSMCLWEVDYLGQMLVVGTGQGGDVGRILLFETKIACMLLSGDHMFAKTKVSKPIVAVQALDRKHLVVSVDYMLLVYVLNGPYLQRIQRLSTSRTVTSIDCKDGEHCWCILLVPFTYL